MKPEEIGILIVDDEASVRDSLYQWFKADGYRVDTADEATGHQDAWNGWNRTSESHQAD
ncbi:MAG: hypothetical protein NTY86_04020 [Deltaproteobacteria bacterium]|nr:hypothetical protein [Deltaproteobacteria bacterium]